MEILTKRVPQRSLALEVLSTLSHKWQWKGTFSNLGKTDPLLLCCCVKRVLNAFSLQISIIAFVRNQVQAPQQWRQSKMCTVSRSRSEVTHFAASHHCQW